MITFMDSMEKLNEPKKCLDSQLWHACAGSMVQMPLVNSKVFYFPQGHVEHACGNVEFRNCPRVPVCIFCRVSAIKFLADLETDEVYAKIRLVPPYRNDFDDDAIVGINGLDGQDKPTSFVKTLTQSDANNGGGFTVPHYCANTIFPRLDYSTDHPAQTLLVNDVHGNTWNFRHIYLGVPKRHLLTTGWSTFIDNKKLVGGDSLVFIRTKNGDLSVGIRRVKKGIGGGPKSSYSGNPAGGNGVVPYEESSALLKEDDNEAMRRGNDGSSSGSGSLMGSGKVRPESVIEAATLAFKKQPFEVVYYPRAGTPEYCVKTSLVKAALQIRWCPGMKFKMPFETEDSSRIIWFMGTITSTQVQDPIRWPYSPWRRLQVTWDEEPDLLQNVKRVSPWVVELVSNMPTVDLFPFSPPRKKLRLPQQLDVPLDSQLSMPTFSSNLHGPNSPVGCLPDNIPAGMQGARQTQYGLSLSSIHVNIQQPGPFPAGFPQLDHAAIPKRPPNNEIINKPSSSENISCLLTMENSTGTSKKSDNQKPQFFLFGQPIFTEPQISLSCSSVTVSPVCIGNTSSEGNADKMVNISDNSGSDSALRRHSVPERTSCEGIQGYKNNRLCKIYMESEDVHGTLDFSLLGSYEELYRKLACMCGIKSSEMRKHVLYRGLTGAVKQVGDEPFSNFVRTARRLTILTDSSSKKVGK